MENALVYVNIRLHWWASYHFPAPAMHRISLHVPLDPIFFAKIQFGSCVGLCPPGDIEVRCIPLDGELHEAWHHSNSAVMFSSFPVTTLGAGKWIDCNSAQWNAKRRLLRGFWEVCFTPEETKGKYILFSSLEKLLCGELTHQNAAGFLQSWRN